jgi:hypothetical protein
MFHRLLILSPLIIVSLVALGLLGGCTTSSWLRKADSTLPVEIVPTNSEHVTSVRAHESSDRLYVTGSASLHQFGDTYVQVQLIGPNEDVINTEYDTLISSLHPLRASARSGKQTYVVSFPLQQARKAEKIRVRVRQGQPEGNS